MAFEGILSTPDAKPAAWRRWMLGVSLGLHGAALTAGGIHSLWQVEELPMPQVEVSLVANVPPPPPPPPPPARKKTTKTTKTKPVEAKPQTIVQPKEDAKPPEEKPEEQEDDGVEGGVEGGVAGGVVGGVVGSTGNAPPPKQPKDTGPARLSSKIGRGLLLINPNADPYRVRLPPALERSGMTHSASMQICVNAQGVVTGVRITRSGGPALDSQLMKVVPRWRYRPYTRDGRPIPFCYPARYVIQGR